LLQVLDVVELALDARQVDAWPLFSTRAVGALSPKAATLLWLEEAHEFGSLPAYVDWLIDQRISVAPLERAPRLRAGAGAGGDARAQCEPWRATCLISVGRSSGLERPRGTDVAGDPPRAGRLVALCSSSPKIGFRRALGAPALFR